MGEETLFEDKYQNGKRRKQFKSKSEGPGFDSRQLSPYRMRGKIKAINKKLRVNTNKTLKNIPYPL